MITYLSKLYKYDENNKFQNKIQDLLYNKRIYGGNTKTDNTMNTMNKNIEVLKHKSTDDAVKIILSDDIIKALEKNVNKINDLILKSNEAQDSETRLGDSSTIYSFTPNGIPNLDETFRIFSDYEDTNTFNKKSGALTSSAIEKDENKQGNPTSLTIKGQLQSKKEDIQKIEKEIRTNLNKFSDVQLDEKGNTKAEVGKYIKELNEYLKPIEDLFLNIEKTPELQTYPLIKRIYDEYIKYKDDKDSKDNEKSQNPRKIIDDFISNSKKVLENNLEKTKLLLSRYELMIKSFESIISNRQNMNNRNNGNMNGGGLINIIKGGAGNDEALKKLKNIQGTSTLKDLVINLKKLKGNRDIKNNVEKTLATPNFIDGEGLNLFDRLLERYDNDYRNNNIPHEITKNNFYNKVKNLNLDPEEELKITMNDKIIFAIVIYIIRVIVLYICYYIIDKNQVTNIRKILISYILWYIIIFVIIIFIINVDTFKLRILVNYINLHINSLNLLIHILLMGGFIYLIYALIYNIDGYDQPKVELTDNEKIKLKYKLDLLTIFVYIFICILLFII
jgi:hypothetical protein